MLLLGGIRWWCHRRGGHTNVCLSLEFVKTTTPKASGQEYSGGPHCVGMFEEVLGENSGSMLVSSCMRREG